MRLKFDIEHQIFGHLFVNETKVHLFIKFFFLKKNQETVNQAYILLLVSTHFSIHISKLVSIY